MQKSELNIEKSRRIAESHGYVFTESQHKEFEPFMYRKSDNSKWIHSISRLAEARNVLNYELLKDQGYNVDDYYNFNADKEDFISENYKNWRQIVEASEKIYNDLIGKINISKDIDDMC